MKKIFNLNFVVGTGLLIMLGLYFVEYQERTKKFKQAKMQNAVIQEVKATFVAKVETQKPGQPPHEQCFTLEGSKRSFDATKEQATPNSKFVVSKLVGDDGEECVYLVTKDGKDWLTPKEDKFCLDYVLPPTYCQGGKHLSVKNKGSLMTSDDKKDN